MNSKVTSDVIEKIRKCFALSKSNWEHEADTAMRMAKKLMDMHGLSMADVEMDKETHHIKRESFKEHAGYEARDLWPWEKDLARVLQNLLPVKFFIRGGSIMFVGAASDAALCAEAYKILRTELLRISRPEPTPAQRRSFLTGCTDAMLTNSMRIAREQEGEPDNSACRDLVVVKGQDVQKYVKEHYSFSSSVQRGSALYNGSYERGREAGRNVNLDFSQKLESK